MVSPHVAHNIYLQLASELGIVGLLLFMGIVLASFLAAERAASTAKAVGDQDLELLARSLLLSLVGFMSSDVFLSGEFAKQLYLVFALCPAALAIARAQLSSGAELADQRVD